MGGWNLRWFVTAFFFLIGGDGGSRGVVPFFYGDRKLLVRSMSGMSGGVGHPFSVRCFALPLFYACLPRE